MALNKIAHIRLGDLLVKDGKITSEQLQVALQVQKEKKSKLGNVLIELKYVTNNDILEVLELQLGIPRLDLERYIVDPEVPKILSEDFARKNLVLPIKTDGNILTVVMADPLNIILINDIEIITGYRVDQKVALDSEITNAIDKYFSKNKAEKAVEEFTKDLELGDNNSIDKEILREVNKAPVVRLVNTIILQAAQQNASDIHIEPEEDYLRIRFRVDGDLSEIMRPSNQTHGAIITRIKIMAKMNIAERRKAQDGRIEMVVNNRDLDLRVSSIPTIYGEKIVIRILDRSTFLRDKTELGLLEKSFKNFNTLLKNKNGIILVTGPTGSGKSTTLYSMLSELNNDSKNILTIEDPVEYRMKGIIQSQVNAKAGFDFSNGLRSFLRQDPDIIMVGEIRDHDTAEIAMRAAITGHLVISTLHTNSAVSTIFRLINMGIEPYLVASSIKGIIAQLLVKKTCEECKLPYIPDEIEKKALGIRDDENIELYKGMGCSKCGGTGFKGRIAIYEIVMIDQYARKLIIKGASIDDLEDYVRKSGNDSIQDNCRQLVLNGVTTFGEFMKITHSFEE
ncbi:GspE/PulE family protein [Helicovermis profundi]